MFCWFSFLVVRVLGFPFFLKRKLRLSRNITWRWEIDQCLIGGLELVEANGSWFGLADNRIGGV